MRLIYFLLAISICFPRAESAAGVLETLSQGAYYVGTKGKGCSRSNPEKLKSAMNKTIKTCLTGLQKTSGSLRFQKKVLNRITSKYKNAEDMIFPLLGTMHSAELSCLSKSAGDLVQSEKMKKNIAEKIKALREVHQILKKETEELAQDTKTSGKICAPSILQLEKDHKYFKGTLYKKCKRILIARNSKKIILASIPLSGVPPIKKFIQHFSSLSDEKVQTYLLSKKIYNSIEESYNKAQDYLSNESKKLIFATTYRKQYAQTWKNFLSDKHLIDKLTQASGKSEDFKAAICKKEASFGKGRDYLDNGLLAGSVILTGGATALARFGGAAALKLAKTASYARTSGILSRGHMAMLQITVGTMAAGSQMATFYSQLDKNCFSQAPSKFIIRTDSHKAARSIQSVNSNFKCACNDIPSPKDVDQGNCLLTASLGAVGLPLLFPKGAKNSFKAVGKFIKNSPQTALVSHTVGDIMIKPFRQLAQIGSVNVVGRTFSSKTLGKKVARRVNAFDDSMKEKGFRIPDSTRIIMADRPILPSMIGPFSISRRIFNIKDFKMVENTIAMNPILYRTKAAKDGSALLHERTHGVLHATYRESAYINRNSTVQEALADFMAAHYYGKPGLGVGVLEKGVPLRNIKTGVASNGKNSETKLVQNISHLENNNEHHNSMLYSQVLWSIRTKVGKKRMNQLIKPMIDDLNSHKSSINIPGTTGSATYETNNYAYYLASLRKTLSERGANDAVKIIDNHATHNIINGRMKHFSYKLNKSGDYHYLGGESRGQALLLHSMGTGAVATEGYLLYKYIKD